MDHPSQLFNRIRRQRARPTLPRQGGTAAPVPAPAPIRSAADTQSSVPTAPVSATPPQPAPAARTAKGHALYSQVMRSHDRMGTRHL